MKALVSSIAGGNYLSRALEKQQAANHIRVRGTPGKPESPRDLAIQSASRSVLLSWKLPVFHDDIAGWRVYQGTESNLVSEIRDKGTRQVIIPMNSGTTPQRPTSLCARFQLWDGRVQNSAAKARHSQKPELQQSLQFRQGTRQKRLVAAIDP